MKITNEAKSALQDIFSSNNANCLKAIAQQTCCGTSVTFTLAKLEEGDTPIVINGISVLVESSLEEKINSITIQMDDGELSIIDESSSGCC